METYRIVRVYHPSLNKQNEVMQEGLTIEEAKEHCNDPTTHKENEYFDSFVRGW